VLDKSATALMVLLHTVDFPKKSFHTANQQIRQAKEFVLASCSKNGVET